MFSTPPFPFAGLLPALASVPNYHSNPITQRVRRKRQRLPPSLLIENASDIFLAFQRTACPRRFRSRLATTRKLHRARPERDRGHIVTTDRLCGIERLPTYAPSCRGPEPRAVRRARVQY